MPPRFRAFGAINATQEVADLRSERARQIARACSVVPGFQLIELRHSDVAGGAEVVVVDAINDQVPTRNAVGIKARERLALVVPVDESRLSL